MKYSVQSLVEELLEEGIITTETGNRITDYYHQKKDGTGASRMISIFGILGALLVGIGLILIVAHNWDDLSRSTKSVLSILPVILGSAGCGYALIKQQDSFAWKEGSAVFLTFAFGACVALISQIYNIPGSLKGYMLTWTIAILPLVYLMSSRVTSLLYIIGVTAYGCMAGFGTSPGWHTNMPDLGDRIYHWLLMGAILPFYYHLIKSHPRSNTTYFHHWVLPIGIAIISGTIEIRGNSWLFIVFFGLFSCYYLWSSSSHFKSLSLFANGYRIIGSLGMIILLLMFSFIDNWSLLLREESNDFYSTIGSNAFIVSLFLSALAAFLLYQKKQHSSWSIMDFGFIVFPILVFTALGSPVAATVLTNLFILVMAIGTIYKGSEENHLGIVNYGLLIITALILCRFFDVDIPFVIRGLLFIGVGLSFFMVNYKIIQRRKTLNQ